MVNQQSGKMTKGCGIKVNYLSSHPENGKENTLGNIQKSLPAACQPKSINLFFGALPMSTGILKSRWGLIKHIRKWWAR